MPGVSITMTAFGSWRVPFRGNEQQVNNTKFVVKVNWTVGDIKSYNDLRILEIIYQTEYCD